MDQALGWVVDFCMQDDACAAAYPDLEETVHAAGHRLTEDPKLTVAGEEIDAEMMSELIDSSNARATPFTAYLPQVFTELAAGETATLEKLVTGGFDPDRSAAAIMAQYGAGLGDLDRTLAEVALMEGDQMLSAGDAAAKLLSTLSNDLATYGALNTEALLDEALSYVATRLEADTLLAFLRDYTLFIGQDPDRSAIETLIATHMPDVEQPRLLGMVAAMTEEDVAAFY